jgi:peroxiredoxin
MKKRGGTLMAVCSDSVKDCARVVEKAKFPFTILSDPKCETIRAYGLLHAKAGPGGADITIPAHALIDKSGKIVWRHAARLVTDRPDPDEVLQAIRSHLQ